MLSSLFSGSHGFLHVHCSCKSCSFHALQVFLQLRMIDLLRDNITTLPQNIANIQPSQPTAAVHNCSQLDKGWWSWQRLTVPKSKRYFKPNRMSPLFPPPTYAGLPASNISKQFFRGYAAQICPPVLKSTTASQQMLVTSLNGPPGRDNEAGYDAAMKEVLQVSATLDDVKKVIAECKWDGPLAHSNCPVL